MKEKMTKRDKAYSFRAVLTNCAAKSHLIHLLR